MDLSNEVVDKAQLFELSQVMMPLTRSREGAREQHVVAGVVVGVDPAVNDVPRGRPGVTWLQPPVVFSLLVSVSGIVTNGTCRLFLHYEHCEGAAFVFQWK